MGGQQRLLRHFASVVADRHPVSDAKSAGVGQDDAGHDIRHRRRGTQRKQHAKKYADALEGRRLFSRQVGHNHDGCKCQDQEANDLVGGLRPFRIKAGDPDTAAFHFFRHQPHKVQHVTHHDQDHDDVEQVGDIPQHGVADGCQGREDVPQQTPALSSGPGEVAEDGGEEEEVSAASNTQRTVCTNQNNASARRSAPTISDC